MSNTQITKHNATTQQQPAMISTQIIQQFLTLLKNYSQDSALQLYRQIAANLNTIKSEPFVNEVQQIADALVDLYNTKGKTAVSRQLVEHLKQLSKGIVPAQYIKNTKVKPKRFSAELVDYIFGQNFALPFTIMIYGRPGQGKTTLALQLANQLASQYKVLYVANEENLFTLNQKVKRLKIGDNVFFSQGLTDFRDFDIVFLDSINSLGLEVEDFRKMKQSGKSFVLIFQTTKQGQFLGKNRWAHEVDIIMKVENGQVSFDKNRFHPAVGFVVKNFVSLNGTFNTEQMATKVKQSTNLEDIKQLILELTGNVKQLNNKVTKLQKDMKLVKEDVAGLKEDVAGLKEDVKVLKAGQARLESRFVRLDRRVSSLIELFLSVPKFSFSGFNFSLLGQNETFVDSADPSKTLGEIDVIYSDDKNKALALIEVKSYVKPQHVKALKAKAANLAKLFKAENPDYKDYDVYWLFAGYKVDDNALEQLEDFGLGFIMLKQARSEIVVKVKPNKKF